MHRQTVKYAESYILNINSLRHKTNSYPPINASFLYKYANAIKFDLCVYIDYKKYTLRGTMCSRNVKSQRL